MLQIRSLFNVKPAQWKKKYCKKLQLYSILALILCSATGVHNVQLQEWLNNVDIIAGDVFFEIIDPPELEYTYRIKPARDFGAPFNSSFLLKRAKLVPMDPIDGCTQPNNIDMIEGGVAFVQRGECSFLHKTIIAESAGARAIIITEQSTGSMWDTLSDDYIEMIADKTDKEANIPAAFLLGRSGAYILRILRNLRMPYGVINLPVNMTFVPIHKMNQPPWISW
ncbi:PRADC1-like protein [Arctopsyche grandis]|uniref:PRADC1-like protein n=1 Tax=Arctopsyche grandis TaxID=121162 RepID=UPI00406DA269